MRRPPTYGVLVTVLAVLMTLLLSSCGSAGTATPTSTRLPDATLKPLRDAGHPASLRDLRGPMVVNLWANWCKPCRRELPIYQQFHARNPEVKVLGVDWMDPARGKALALADRAGLTYPLVVDQDRKIPGQALPKLIMLDAKGRIVFQEYVEIKSLAQLDSLVRTHLKVHL